MMLVAELQTPNIDTAYAFPSNEADLNALMDITRWSHFFPTFYWVSFVVGMCAAQLSVAHESELTGGEGSATPWAMTQLRLRGLLADVCVLLMFIYVCVLPQQYYDLLHGVYQKRGEHLWTLVHTVVLYGSAAGGGAGVWAHCLRHPILVSLGKYAFAAFLFQVFVAQCLDLSYTFLGNVAVADASGNLYDSLYHRPWAQRPLWNATVSVVALLPALWTFAILYTVWFERPVVIWLKRLCGKCCAATRAKGDEADEDAPVVEKAGANNV